MTVTTMVMRGVCGYVTMTLMIDDSKEVCNSFDDFNEDDSDDNCDNSDDDEGDEKPGNEFQIRVG